MQVKDRHGLDELRRLATLESNARKRIRLQAIVHAQQGRTAKEIAHTLDAARRSVQEWVRRYNDAGAEGLHRRPGQGRRCRLTVAERVRMCERLDGGPCADDSVCTLRGRDILRILEREFGKLYHLNGVYALLHRLGYSCLMPRPRHRKADPKAQEAFKKTSWNRSKRFAQRIPKSVWKSGSRMKRASVNKAR